MSLLRGGTAHSLALQPTGSTRTVQTTTYTYDELSRLKEVSAPSGLTQYGYDPVGNRLSRARGGSPTGYSYDRANRITTAGTVSYSVNANGNLVARGPDTFGYDQANRLTSATIGSTTSTYGYDGDGKRTSVTVGANPATGYLHDVNYSPPMLLEDGATE